MLKNWNKQVYWIIKKWDENLINKKCIFDDVSILKDKHVIWKNWDLYYYVENEWSKKIWLIKYWRETDKQLINEFCCFLKRNISEFKFKIEIKNGKISTSWIISDDTYPIFKERILENIWDWKENILKIDNLSNWIFSVFKLTKNWKRWFIKYWDEQLAKEKCIFDRVQLRKNNNDWELYYKAELNWKLWAFKYWEENLINQKFIFDKVIIEDYFNVWYYEAELNWKKWIIKCWDEHLAKEKCIFDNVLSLYWKSPKKPFAAKLNWKYWRIEYWKEYLAKEKCIFD